MRSCRCPLKTFYGSLIRLLSIARHPLIKMWLDCPVEETDQRGRKTRTTEARDKRRGIPQGSPLSPLLANLYMRRFVLGWKKLGLERSLGTRLVTYADDLVILCRKGKAVGALQRLREIMGKLKLTVNEEKTRICKVPEGEFDFLGYIGFKSSASGACMLVAEGQMIADEIADSLNPPPATRARSEMAPRDIGESVGFAIAAAEQKHQSFVRQLFDGDLVGVQFCRIGQAAVLDDGVRRDREVAARRDEPPHCIAECIEIGPCWNRRTCRRRDFVAQLLRTLAVRVEEANHQGWLRTIKRQFIAVSYEHDPVPTLARVGARATLGLRLALAWSEIRSSHVGLQSLSDISQMGVALSPILPPFGSPHKTERLYHVAKWST